MESGIYAVDLELRQRGQNREISGSFPYRQTAVIADRGRVRKERMEPKAFAFAVEDRTREINALRGHSFNEPLASKLAGSLELDDTRDALNFLIHLPRESEQTAVQRDTVLQIGQGLLGGISPGFRVPPRSAVPDAEVEEEESGNPGVFTRVIRAAVLFELSLVVRPAYAGTAMSLRHDEQTGLTTPSVEASLWRLL